MRRACNYVLSSAILFSLVVRSSSDGLVYRTGCCSVAQQTPDVAKKTVDFIEVFGFDAEIHEVVTDDGYILTVHRIIPTMTTAYSDYQGIKPVVILQHGIGASSAVWFMNQERSLPFLLVNDGWDVWVLDTRGNSYSRNHTYLRTADPTYWRFSFHEQGTLDLPATIDYILELTGNEKVFYVGHSRGTTMMMVLLATRPEYNDKVQLASFLAPVAYVRNNGNSLVRLLFSRPLTLTIKGLIKALNAYIVPSSSDASIQFREIICNRTKLACVDVVFAFSGYDYDLLNKSMIHIYFSHYPEGGATQEYLHYLQIGNTDKFCQFDYGPEENMKRYGSATPPEYDFSRITAPISLHYGDNDLLVRPKDLQRLIPKLQSVVGMYRIPFKKFSHTDFLWAIGVENLVYKSLMELMNERLLM